MRRGVAGRAGQEGGEAARGGGWTAGPRRGRQTGGGARGGAADGLAGALRGRYDARGPTGNGGMIGG
nr:hypothetical protein StreXyl84_17630 [Streptomyces sp. Xyl84]